MPVPAVEPVASALLSRGSRQRVNRRRHCQQDVADCVASLNWLSGYNFDGGCANEPTAAQLESHHYISNEVESRPLPTEFSSSEEAACTLLRARPGGYDAGAGPANTAPYREGAVSLPESAHDAPCLRSVLPAASSRLLDSFETHMLCSLQQRLEVTDHGPTVKPYMDPVLARNHGKYVGFIWDLLRRGVLQWTLRPAEFVGLFFVPKKGSSLRLIVDARASNTHFQNPPGVVMAGPEVFANS